MCIRDRYYSTDEYIEKIAREQLGLVMPDEIVFKVDVYKRQVL